MKLPRRSFLLGALAGFAASEACLGKEATLITPADSAYRPLCQWYNPRIRHFPQAIALVRSPADIARALELAWARGWPVSVRSGGHSYAGLSGGNGLLIDVSRMTSLRWDGDRIWLGAGWRLGPLRTYLARQGRMLPLGWCPGVGLSGYLLGGGYGPTARVHGLGCDSVLDAKLVNACGQDCLASQHHDLLWALKGCGYGQFGVVYEWLLQTRPLDKTVVVRRELSEREIVDSLSRWLLEAPKSDPRFTSFFHLEAGAGQLLASAGGLFLGSLAECLESDWDPGTQTTPLPYLEAMNALGGETQIPLPAFRATSDYLNMPFTQSLIKELIELVKQGSPCRARLTFDAYGGAIERGTGAFPHRTGLLSSLQALGLEEPDSDVIQRWMRSYQETVRPHCTGAGYPNYAESDRIQWQAAFFGSSWSRLAEVKRAHDPQRLFQHPLSLEPAGTNGEI